MAVEGSVVQGCSPALTDFRILPFLALISRIRTPAAPRSPALRPVFSHLRRRIVAPPRPAILASPPPAPAHRDRPAARRNSRGSSALVRQPRSSTHPKSCAAGRICAAPLPPSRTPPARSCSRPPPRSPSCIAPLHTDAQDRHRETPRAALPDPHWLSPLPPTSNGTHWPRRSRCAEFAPHAPHVSPSRPKSARSVARDAAPSSSPVGCSQIQPLHPCIERESHSAAARPEHTAVFQEGREIAEGMPDSAAELGLHAVGERFSVDRLSFELRARRLDHRPHLLGRTGARFRDRRRDRRVHLLRRRS